MQNHFHNDIDKKNGFLKVAKSQEVFHFGSDLRKKTAKSLSWAAYLYLDSAQGMEIVAKLKASLRLSYLDHFMIGTYLYNFDFDSSSIFFDVVPFVWIIAPINLRLWLWRKFCKMICNLMTI